MNFNLIYIRYPTLNTCHPDNLQPPQNVQQPDNQSIGYIDCGGFVMVHVVQAGLARRKFMC